MITMDKNFFLEKEKLLKEIDEATRRVNKNLEKFDKLEKEVSEFIDLLHDTYQNFFDVNFNNPKNLTKE